MKKNISLLFSLLLFILNNTFSQINLLGQFRTEGWDMFWLAKAGKPLGAPETFSSRGRTVDFNIDIDSTITSARLEFDYFDGDFLLDIEQQYTSFNVIVDGQVVDSVEFQNNSIFQHKSIDITQWIKKDRYSLPVTFCINQSKSKDGVIIARPYLVLNESININGFYRTEGWDMFWLAKAGKPLGAPETFSSRGRTVDFNIDIDSIITSARLEFDYFDGDFLLDIEQQYTSFNVIVDGQVVDSVEFQNNSIFQHKSIDITQWIKKDRYSLPVTFCINQSKSKDGVIIARPYLVIDFNNKKTGYYNSLKTFDNEFKIFPNPTFNELNLNFIITDKSKIVFSIYDSQGRVVMKSYESVYDSGIYEEKFNIKNYESGIYFLKIQKSGQNITKPFIVQ